MSLFEGKTTEEAQEEVTSKFISVYAIGFVYWVETKFASCSLGIKLIFICFRQPIAQTINFACVKPKNQVIYVSFASLIWTTFLAYMKVELNKQSQL